MAVVNKFNVNKQEIRLDADIIENMSANDVSYDDSFQYDENTVGNKLSELEEKTSEVYFTINGNYSVSIALSTGMKHRIEIGGVKQGNTYKFGAELSKKIEKNLYISLKKGGDTDGNLSQAIVNTGDTESFNEYNATNDFPEAYILVETNATDAPGCTSIISFESNDNINGKLSAIGHSVSTETMNRSTETTELYKCDGAININKLLGNTDVMTLSQAIATIPQKIRCVGLIISFRGQLQTEVYQYNNIGNITDTYWLQEDNWTSIKNPSIITNVDTELSSTSTNPVQNKVVKAEIDDLKSSVMSADKTNLFDASKVVDGTLTRSTLFAVQSSETDFVSDWIEVKPNTTYYFSHILQRINETAETNKAETSAISQSLGSVGTHQFTTTTNGHYVRFSALKEYKDILYMIESNDTIVYPKHLKYTDVTISEGGAVESGILSKVGKANLYNKALNLQMTQYDAANNLFKFAKGQQCSYPIPVIVGRKYAYSSNVYIQIFDKDGNRVSVNRRGSDNIIRVIEGSSYAMLFGSDSNMEQAYFYEAETDDGYKPFEPYIKLNPQKYDLEYLQKTINPSWNSRWFVGKKLAVDGDSITHDGGIPGAGESYWQYVVRNNLSMNIVSSTFQGTDGQTYTIGSRGIAGSRIAYGEEANPIQVCISSRFQYLPDDADVIIIAGGTNDWSHDGVELGTMSDRTNVTFYGAMHIIAQGLINKYPDKLIVFNTPIKRGRSLDLVNAKGNTLKDFVDAVIEVGGYYGIPVIDLFRGCTMNPSIQSQKDLYFIALTVGDDGMTHPSVAGHKLMGDYVSAKLLTLK